MRLWPFFARTGPARAWWALLIVWATCVPDLALAQAYAVVDYSDVDGLPSRSIWDVEQGPDGRIWVTTRAGVADYDGVTWTHHFAAEGLPFQRFLSFDGDGNVWTLTSTRNPVPLVFDGHSWQRRPANGDVHVSAALTASAGLQRDDGFELAVGTLDGRFFVYRGDRWFEPTGLPASTRPILAIVPWRDDFWVARDDGVWRLAEPSDRFRAWGAEDGPDSPVGLGVDEASDELYVVGRDAIARWDGSALSWLIRATGAPLFPPVVTGTDTVVDPAGTIWLGYFDGLYQWDRRTGSRAVGADEGVASGSATALLLDREHNLWIGSPRGLSKIPSTGLVALDTRHGLPVDEVTVTLELRDATVLLGHPGALSLEGRVIRVPGGEQGGRVLDAIESPDGQIWVAANETGLLRLDRSRTGFQVIPGPWDRVISVLAEADEFWVATVNGVFTGRPGDWRPVLLDGEPMPYVRHLDAGAPGEIWAATYEKGVIRIADGSVRAIPSAVDGGDNAFRTLVRSNGTVLSATAAGLLVLEEETFRSVTPQPAPGRPIYALLETPGGDLWLGTDRGVVVVSGTDIRVIDRRHGLVGNEINRAAMMVDRRGHVWVGTDGGAAIYRPEYDWPRPIGPEVAILAVEAAGERYDLRDTVDLPANAHSLTFHLFAPSFVDETRIRFRARLEGIDGDWMDYGYLPSRELRFPFLPAGRYRLHVQAESIDGLVGPMVSSPDVTIAAPFWGSPWFYLGTLVLLVGVAATASIAVSRGRYATRLEHEVEVRTERLRQAERELSRRRHLDALGSLAAGIAHDFNNHLAAILGNLSLLDADSEDPEVALSLREAIDSVGRARSLSDQLLTFSRGGAPVRVPLDFGELLQQVVDEVPEGVPVVLEVDDEARTWPLRADPGQLRQALCELVRNAVQAGGEQGAVIIGARLDDEGESLVISIVDEGPGIPPEIRPLVFDPFFTTRESGTGLGLTIANSIIRRHGGRLELDEETGHGARAVVVLPAEAPGAPTASTRPGSETAPRVLVMDDEPMLRSLLVRMLERLGAEAVATADGSEAVRQYRDALDDNRPFSAVILDLTVPDGVGGIETIQRLRTLDPDVRAIVASGYSDDATLARARASGFVGTIRKPFEIEDLAVVLRQTLAGRGADA